MATISSYTGDGSTTQFDITFDYESADTVKARVDRSSVSFTWVNPSKVQISPAPTAGSLVEVYRDTDVSEAAVDFTDGAALLAGDLDAGFKQVRLKAEELESELAAASVGLNAERVAAIAAVSGSRSGALEDLEEARTGALGAISTAGTAAAAWAEGTEPGGTGTKSAKGWAEDAGESAAFAEEFSGPAYETIAAGEAATTAGQFFRVSNGDTPRTYTRYQRTSGGSVVAASLATTRDLAIVKFPTVAAMLADTSAARGAGSVWRAGPYTYAEAASSATNHDLTTAGGVKLYVDAPDAVQVEALGAVAGTNFTTALAAAITAASRIGHFKVRIGPGTFNLTPGVIALPQNHFSLVGSGQPLNQDQIANVTRIIASTAGGTLFQPASAFGVMANVTFSDMAIEGASTSDGTTIGIDLSSCDALYGVKLINVAFNNMATGYIPPSGNGVNQGSFQHHFSGVSVWNIRNVGVYGANGPSNIFEMCRAGKLTGGPQVNITSITRANPAVVTATAHGLSNGDLVWIEGAGGMAASDGAVHINDRLFTVANATADTYELRGYDTSGLATAYTSGGTCRKAAVAFWSRGDNDLVIQGDTAALSSTGGTVQWVIGEDPELGPNAAFRVSSVKFETTHFEACAGHVYVTSGSRIATASDIHANAHFVAMPWSFRFRYLDGHTILRMPNFNTQPGASYASHIYVEQIRRGNALLTIVPCALIDTLGTSSTLPIVAGTTGGTTGAAKGWLKYDCRTVFEATHNSTQSVTSGTETQLVNFGNEIVDSHGCHASGVYVAKAPGMYTIGGSIEYPSTVDTSRYEIRYKINGTEVERDTDHAASSGSAALVVGKSFQKWLNVGDQITWHAFYNGGGSIAIASSIRNRIFVVGPN